VLAYDLGIIVNLPKIEIYFLQASGFLVSGSVEKVPLVKYIY